MLYTVQLSPKVVSHPRLIESGPTDATLDDRRNEDAEESTS